jgi:hypothetical protein
MKLIPPKEYPHVGRPKIEGITRGIKFQPELISRIKEYQNFVENKTSFRPNFNDTIRTLVNIGLNSLGIKDEKEEESEV